MFQPAFNMENLTESVDSKQNCQPSNCSAVKFKNQSTGTDVAWDTSGG